MSLETDLFATLKSLVGNRVAPVEFPQPPARPTWPAIRYTIVSTTPIQDLCGDGDDDTSDHRVQLDVVAEGFEAARLLRLQVMDAMRSFPVPARLENSISTKDATTKTYREILEYLIQGSTGSGSP